jgi:tetratricopeptide (TPR) repeat protein
MRGRLDVTELIIDKSLDKFSRRLCSGFGFDYLKRGEYDKAEQIYIEAIDSGDPSLMSEGHAYLGELFFQLGRTNEAITHFKMVTDLSTLPGTVSTLTLGVALQEERSDLDGAEEAFSKVVEHGDKRLLAVAAGRLAWLRLHRDDNVGAIEICRRGLESTKDDQESTLLFLLASALRREGRLQEAEPVAVRAANHCGPEDGFQSWSLLGAIREELGDPRGALRAYNRAITFDAPEGQSREQNQE